MSLCLACCANAIRKQLHDKLDSPDYLDQLRQISLPTACIRMIWCNARCACHLHFIAEPTIAL